MPGAIRYLHSIDLPAQDSIALPAVAVSTFARFFGDPAADPRATPPGEVVDKVEDLAEVAADAVEDVHDDRVAGPAVAEQLGTPNSVSIPGAGHGVDGSVAVASEGAAMVVRCGSSLMSSARIRAAIMTTAATVKATVSALVKPCLNGSNDAA
jgi:hypothetical protein